MKSVGSDPLLATAAAEKEGFRLQVKLAPQRDVAHERSAGFAGHPLPHQEALGEHPQQEGEEGGDGVRSGPGAARTILLFHTISARPSKPSYGPSSIFMELGSYFCSCKNKKRHHHHRLVQ